MSPAPAVFPAQIGIGILLSCREPKSMVNAVIHRHGDLSVHRKQSYCKPRRQGC